MYKHFFTILLIITSLSCQAMELATTPQNNSYFTDMATVPEKCIELLKKLDDQPIFDDKSIYSVNVKKLPLRNYSDGRIVEILCRAAEREQENNNSQKTPWSIKFFDNNSEIYNRIYSQDYSPLKKVGILK